jgi:predicted dithiol-disulfide oxidoreductase (DUF899 family)
MSDHTVGTRDEWTLASEELLVKEREHTRRGDELAAQRRALPWVRIEKQYRFDTDDGVRTLAELFDGRSQLLVYHFMFGASYESGCPTNSSIADAIDGLVPHLNACDATIVLVSGAPIERLQAYKRRMGWTLPWVSCANGSFNREIGFSGTEDETREWVTPIVAELPAVASRNARATGTDLARYLAEGFGFTAFALEGESVYQTYATTARGVEFLMSYYAVLDRAPKGRDEGSAFQMWIRRRDEYEVEQ